MMRRRLFPVALLLLAAVAPAASDSAPKGVSREAISADGPLLVYSSRPGDTLQAIKDQWLLPEAEVRRLQVLNDIPGNFVIPMKTPISVPERWVRTSPVAAMLAAFRGDVRLLRGGVLLPVAKGTELREGDEIETGPNGFVTLALPDASRVSLPSASRIAVERLRRVPLLDSVDRRFTLLRGGSDMKVTPMANPASRFLITTPVAVAAVRGTAYRVRFTPAGMRQTTEVTEGLVAVRLADGSAEVLLGPGFAAIATPAGVSGPLPLPAAPLVALRGRTQSGPSVVFRLQPRPGIARYVVEIAADAGFVDRVASASSSTDTVSLGSVADGHYYARAYLVDGNGLQGAATTFEFDRLLAATTSAEGGELPLPAPPAETAFGVSWFAAGGGGGGAVGARPSPVVAARQAGQLAEAPAGNSLFPQPVYRQAPVPAVSGLAGGFQGFSGAGGGMPPASGDNDPPAGQHQEGAQIPEAGISAIVPEPRTWLLLLTGFALVGLSARLRSRLA